MREGMKLILGQQPDIEIVGEACNGRQAVSETIRLRPDMVLMDLSMPELNGLEAARQIHERFPQIEVVILTLHEANEVSSAALASGARACVVKSDLDNLVAAVRNLLRVEPLFQTQGKTSAVR